MGVSRSGDTGSWLPARNSSAVVVDRIRTRGLLDLKCYLYPGWDPQLRPATARRDWMDAAPESFAYRCLPLAIANAHGWEALTHCGFSARWNGGPGAADVEIVLDEGADPATAPIALFGLGTVTFHLAGLFRTPPGWNLWVGGPPNTARDGIVPLNGLIETDWSPYSFTMNWKLTRPEQWVRFEAGEPYCHLFPVERAVMEQVEPRFLPITDDLELKGQFESWSASRDAFHVRMRDHPPERPSDKWQKLYYRGVDPSGASRVDDHQSKLAVRAFANAPAPVRTIRPAPSRQSSAPPSACPAAGQARDRALAKRDWLLATTERLRALSPETSALYSYSEIDPDEFLARHYASNRPALLQGKIDDWPALARWTPAYLRDAIGDAEVEFQGERGGNARFELDKDAHKRVLPFGAYMDVIERGNAGNDAYITAYNSGRNAAAFAPIMKDIGTIDGILTPGDASTKGMLWIGPDGTFTPLHHDLTNNLLVQVVGRKRVVLVSPNFTPHLYNDTYVFSRIGDLEAGPEALAAFPDVAEVRTYIVDLNPGDALFLPIGWWHQVRSSDFSVSITNTNFVWPNDFHSSFPD